MTESTRANLILLFVTAIWGLTFPLIRNAVAEIDSMTFVWIRFSIAALFLIPFVWKDFKNTTPKLLGYCLIFGLLNTCSYLFQTIGLETTTSARGAFLTGFSVVLVPFLMPLLGLGKATFIEFLCAFICLTGLYILTGASHPTQIARGDIWILASALCWGTVITLLQRASKEIQDYKLLTFYPILFIGPFLFLFSPPIRTQALFQWNAVIGIVVCAILATSLALFLQTKYQKFTTATKAATIFAFEPIFASIAGYVINGEKISINTFWGGLLIFTSFILPQLKDFLRGSDPR